MDDHLETESDKPRKDISTLAKGASITLGGKIGGKGFHTLGQILLARMLGVELFGLYALGWTLVNIMGLIVPLGLQNGVIHFGAPGWQSGERNQRKFVYRAFWISMAAGLLLGGGTYLFAPYAVLIFDKPGLLPVIRGFALALPFIAGLRVAAAATRISERMGYSVYAEELLQPVSYLVMIFILYRLGAKLTPSVVAGSVSFGLAWALAVFYMGKIFPPATGEKAPEISTKHLLQYSITTTFSGLFTMLILWVDRLLVGYFLPAGEVGIYQVASQTAMFFGIVLTAFNTIFTPMIARLYYAGDRTRLGEMFKISTKWGLYLSVPFFIVIFFASEKVMTAIYGQEYGPGWPALLILAFAQLVNAGTGAVGFMLNMTGHQKKWVSTAGLMLVFNMVFNWFMIPRWGITGSAIATGSSVIGLFVIGLVHVRKINGFWPYDRRYWKGGMAALAAMLGVYGIGFISMPDLLYLLVAGTIATLIFVGVLALTGFDAEDREVIAILRRKFLPM